LHGRPAAAQRADEMLLAAMENRLYSAVRMRIGGTR
jgi:hypothetical protein